MVKFACPSLLAHSSLGSDMYKGDGPSDMERIVLALGRLWNEVMDGWDDKGGEGIVTDGFHEAGIAAEAQLSRFSTSSEMSATVGDSNGEVTPATAAAIGSSPMNGGSNGVLAW